MTERTRGTSMLIYRALLRLLPRDRRLRHGRQMQAVFADQRDEARRQARPLSVAGLWMKETAGLLRFSAREWAGRFGRWIESRLPAPWSRGPATFFTELRWAWRGMRSRGARAWLIIALLGVALAANTIVFAAADSFVFNRVPYRDAARLVEIGEQSVFGWNNGVLPEAAPVWRSFTDLFSSFYTYQEGGAITYLKGGNEPRFVADARVQPGLLDMLGVRPVAGRLFVNDDAHAPPVTASLVAEEIARQEFGSPQNAIGRPLKVGSVSTTIVGVLPVSFRFPSGSQRIWTPLDMASQRLNYDSRTIAKMAPGMMVEALNSAVKSRSVAVQSRLSPPWNRLSHNTQARSIEPAQVDPRLRRLFVLLCAAAGCLLLVACANVVNLELATGLMRTRTYAVQIALGASGGTLLRTALLEGAVAISAASVLSAALAGQGMTSLSSHLPAAMTTTLTNRLHFDGRAFVFMIAIAVITWLVTSLPVAIVAFRTNVLDSLKLDGRTLSSSRGGTRVRQSLTIVEVAMTVLLLVGALLNVRSYSALLAIPKGFDTAGVVSITVRQSPGSHEKDRDLQDRLLAGIKARPDVVAATVTGASLPASGNSVSARLQIVGRAGREGLVTLAAYHVDLEYFKAMRLPLRDGREFLAGDPPSDVVVDEGFAKRYWPDGTALGARFTLSGSGWNNLEEWQIIGIAAHMRTFRDSVSAASDDYFPVYDKLSASAAPLGLAVRLADPSKIDDLANMIRTLTPGARVSSEFIRDRYANMFANEMLAASIMSAFGALAFLVAMAGIYGVMAYLVASRTREIGIRVALGADRQAINRFVLNSSLRLVIAGAAIGLVTALAASRFVQSVLFGVSSTDPRIYGVVVLTVIVTAGLATWQPARRAGRIDPSELFRN